MNYLVVPYQILFEDTMAYGSHHYLTNFRFQCIAREHVFFNGLFDKKTFENVVMLTQQGYSRNMAPAFIGDRVAIFLTFDEPSRSTIRLCFRVVRYDGIPICCGYQVLVFTSTKGEIIPIPSVMTDYVMQNLNLVEKLTEPPFAQRVVRGGKETKSIFTEEVCELGKIIASERASRLLGGAIVNTSELTVFKEVFSRETNYADLYFQSYQQKSSISLTSAKNSDEIALMFPGQGSYHYETLHDLYFNYPEAQAYFAQADIATQKYFDRLFSPVARAASQTEHDFLLQQFSELDQVGIFLSNVVIAELLIKGGLKPDLLIGHSFGEISAMVVGGLFEFRTGLDIVCKRIKALSKIGDSLGRMLAVTCNSTKLPQLVEAFQQKNLTTAVINHSSQIVLSGSIEEITQIELDLTERGISCTLLKSRYPFHSLLLAPAVEDFRSSLKDIAFKQPKIPVYSPIEKSFLNTHQDLASIIASGLIKPFNFCEAISFISSEKNLSFIECGSGHILNKIVQKNILPSNLAKVWTTTTKNQTIAHGIKNILKEYSLSPDNLKQYSAPSLKIDKSSDKPNSISERISLSPRDRDGSGNNLDANMPIAIVSMGCLLPGASNPEHYWQNIVSGVSGIIDLGDLDPSLIQDFKSDGDIVADKTYTLLGGKVPNLNYEEGLPYTKAEFERLTRSQKLLAKAFRQCLTPIQNKILSSTIVNCLIGSTADGIEEYDEALFAESIRKYLARLDEPEALKKAFLQSLPKVISCGERNSHNISPYNCYKSVVNRFLGSNTELTLLDAACASSLYTTDIGIELLRNRQSDLVFSGGVFAPSMAMSTLFAQFGGLSATGSNSFDSRADGVVFTEGAAVIALKRLADALKDGDSIYGVIRSVGTSSDGKSSAVNVPKTAGQYLACKRALQKAAIDVDSLQYIEAHATSTPTGDATEYKSLTEAYAQRSPSIDKIALGSVKSLIGHTGWTAGVASIIKVCKAFEAKLFPPQYNYQSPNKEIELKSSPFEIFKRSQYWSENLADLPRRAAVNGFGFGGTNANLILEEYKPDYHAQFFDNDLGQTSNQVFQPISLALVGASTLFPAPNGDRVLTISNGTTEHFNRSSLHLPIKKRILPDVTEDMDSSQYLCVMATERALANIDKKTVAKLKDKIGLVVGMAGKTGRGVAANERIFLDRLQRIFQEKRTEFVLEDGDFERICQKLFKAIKAVNRPSSPYTLTGLMPNVTTGRVCNLFDFKGSNIVIDGDNISLLKALRIAQLQIAKGELEIALAGSISTQRNHETSSSAEAACLLALTSLETAKANNLPILAVVELNNKGVTTKTEIIGEKTQLNFHETTGANEIAIALKHLNQTNEAVAVSWSKYEPNKPNTLTFTSPVGTNQNQDSSQKIAADNLLKATSWSSVAQSLQKNPISYYSPALFSETISQFDLNSASSLDERKILFLTDRPQWWNHLHRTQALSNLNFDVACPMTQGISGAIAIDLSSEETIKQTMGNLDFNVYDTIIALKNLESNNSESDLLSVDDSEPLLNLLFVISRFAYSQIEAKKIALVTLCLNVRQDRLHPYTGLFAGFIKSLARELPTSFCKSISTDIGDFKHALSQVNRELNHRSSNAVEIFYIKGERQVFKLVPTKQVTKDTTPYLDSHSVVIATGGGRGVTAVLVEEILLRFGCTVFLLGRTDLNQIPESVLEMDEDSFIEYESKFYQEQLAQNPQQKIPDLKRKYESYQAARELNQSLVNLSALPGKIEYASVDVTDLRSVEGFTKRVCDRYKKIDFVIHGAGVQLSKLLPKRKLNEFQGVLSTKLAGLKNLQSACKLYLTGNQPHFHILTSAFSYIGNDGQPDYGAANEYMNRLALYMSNLGHNWSTIAWLGWAGIGMTRGSEYKVLSKSRGLRAITHLEGRYLFTLLLNGRATNSINILLTAGEKNFYQVDVVSQVDLESQMQLPKSSLSNGNGVYISTKNSFRNQNDLPQFSRQQFKLSPEIAPYLLDHLVSDVPTLPATFEQELVVQAAQMLRPERKLVGIENSSFTKFVKFFNHQEKQLFTEAKILVEDSGESLINVKLMSDFTHKSGVVLEKNSVHCEMNIRLASSLESPSIQKIHPEWSEFAGETVLEPYMIPNSFVKLGGVFDCLSDIVISSNLRRARFKFKNPEMLSLITNFSTPAILIDAMLRLATASPSSVNYPTLYVPQGWQKITLFPNLNDYQLNRLGQELFLIGSDSQIDEDQFYCEWLQVIDINGRVILLLEQAHGVSKNSRPLSLQA